MMGHTRLTKVTIASFPPKKNVANFSKNHVALYFVIHFNDFL